MGEGNDKIKRKKKYLEKYKDPRWQKLRLEVLNRDEWCCLICFDDKSTLHVHHMKYIRGNDPWDYPIGSLVTLCDTCHKSESEERNNVERLLLDTLKDKGFFSHHIDDLVDGFRSMELVHVHDVISSTLSWVLKTPIKLNMLIDEYLVDLGKRREMRDKGKEVK